MFNIQFDCYEAMNEFYDPEGGDCSTVNIVRRLVTILLFKYQQLGKLGFTLQCEDTDILDYKPIDLYSLYDSNPIYQNAIESLLDKYHWEENLYLSNDDGDPSFCYPKWFLKKFIKILEDYGALDYYSVSDMIRCIDEGMEEDLSLDDLSEFEFADYYFVKTFCNTKIDALIAASTNQEALFKKIKENFNEEFFISLGFSEVVLHENHVYFINIQEKLTDSQGYTYDVDLEKYYNFNLFKLLPTFDMFLDSLAQEPQ